MSIRGCKSIEMSLRTTLHGREHETGEMRTAESIIKKIVPHSVRPLFWHLASRQERNFWIEKLKIYYFVVRSVFSHQVSFLGSIGGCNNHISPTMQPPPSPSLETEPVIYLILLPHPMILVAANSRICTQSMAKMKLKR